MIWRLCKNCDCVFLIYTVYKIKLFNIKFYLKNNQILVIYFTGLCTYIISNVKLSFSWFSLREPQQQKLHTVHIIQEYAILGKGCYSLCISQGEGPKKMLMLWGVWLFKNMKHKAQSLSEPQSFLHFPPLLKSESWPWV